MTITADKTTINIGDTVNLQAHFWDINGAEIIIQEATTDHLITWSSDNTLIATVAAASTPSSGEKAVGTGVAGGISNITADLISIATPYGYSGNTTANIEITVLGPPPVSCEVGNTGPAGGTIFFCDDPNNKVLSAGEIGLEAAPSDQSSSYTMEQRNRPVGRTEEQQ